MAVDDGDGGTVNPPCTRDVDADGLEAFHDRREAPPYCEECYEADVGKLDVYRLTGVNWNGMFCERHDPRDRPGEGHMWEEYHGD